MSEKLKSGTVRGFTLIELVVVISLIAILAAVALPRMMNINDNAHEAAVLGAGSAMSSAMILARSQWVAGGRSLAVDGITGFGNDDIATSAEGWPSDAGMSAGSNHSAVMDSPERCVRLWRGVLVANAPSVASSVNSGADYLVDTISGNCRYTYQRSGRGSHILYNARTGEVITVI